jgi:hypothetical protein
VELHEVKGGGDFSHWLRTSSQSGVTSLQQTLRDPVLTGSFRLVDSNDVVS